MRGPCRGRGLEQTVPRLAGRAHGLSPGSSTENQDRGVQAMLRTVGINREQGEG